METSLLPIALFMLLAAAMAVGIYVLGKLIGPKRNNAVKEMPYESGMDPIHDTHRRFDVRFHLVAIAFLVFDVELLFLYPWAVAVRNTQGTDEKNPFEFEYVRARIEHALREYEGRFIVMSLPNITSILYGRNVGYTVERIDLDSNIQDISATDVRRKMSGKS